MAGDFRAHPACDIKKLGPKKPPETSLTAWPENLLSPTLVSLRGIS